MNRSAIACFDSRVNHGISGTITFTQLSPAHPVEIAFDLQGFHPRAVHAIHIHEFGDLTKGCASLGGHFNPKAVPHGHGLRGHAGDLFNNLQADARGRFVSKFQTPLLSLCPGSAANIAGRSVVIHQFADDLGRQGVWDAQHGYVVPYDVLSTDQLKAMSKERGYPTGSRHAMLQKFNTESITTGNAATRIACAIIGWRLAD